MQIKTTVSYYLTPVRMPIVKKIVKTSIEEDMEKRKSSSPMDKEDAYIVNGILCSHLK